MQVIKTIERFFYTCLLTIFLKKAVLAIAKQCECPNNITQRGLYTACDVNQMITNNKSGIKAA
jgi:hypothetical protein